MLSMMMVMVVWMMMIIEQVLWAQLQCEAKESWKSEEVTGKGFKAKNLKHC